MAKLLKKEKGGKMNKKINLKLKFGKNKKFLALSLFLMFCVSFVHADERLTLVSPATKLPPEWANIRITLVSQDPDPAEPGEYVDVRFKVENRGSKNAEDVTLELLPKYPFSLDPGIEATRKIGSVHGRQIGDIGVIVKYKLRVDKDAVEGENELELRYKIEDSVWIELEPFIINIQTHDAILAVSSVLSTLEKIKPGGTTTVKINFKNMADSLIKDIKVKLNLDSVPLAPIGSTNEKTIMKLDSKEESIVEFNLIAEADAESKVYKIPMQIYYLDELGNNYGKNNTIGLIIGDKPDISVVIASSEIYSSGKSGDVVIKFVNKGVMDLKFMNVKLGHTDDYDILSLDEVYIGNIDSDDYETAEFKLFVKATKDSEIKIPISMEYKDANNEDYAKSIVLDLKLYSTAETKKLGLTKGNSFVGIVIVVIIVVIGLFVYRRWRKKKKAKK